MDKQMGVSEMILETEELSYSYPDGTQALNKLSVKVKKGEKVVFLGSNGAGKSTLFRHFNGLLKPDRGRILYNETEIGYSKKRLRELRKDIGIVFQDPDKQLFAPTVIQEVSFGPMNLQLSDTEMQKNIDYALAITGTAIFKDKLCHFLSYGEKKRVTIADVLAMKPKVLILDEPGAFLDQRYKKLIIKLLNDINTEGTTIIVSTHDVDFAYSWADTVIVLKNGALFMSGNAVDIFSNEHLYDDKELNYDYPYVLQIYKDLKQNGYLKKHFPLPRTREDLCNLIQQNILKVF